MSPLGSPAGTYLPLLVRGYAFQARSLSSGEEELSGWTAQRNMRFAIWMNRDILPTGSNRLTISSGTDISGISSNDSLPLSTCESDLDRPVPLPHDCNSAEASERELVAGKDSFDSELPMSFANLEHNDRTV